MTCGSLASGAIEVFAFGALSQGDSIVLKRYTRVCLIVRAIERVDSGTVAPQRHDDGTVRVEHDRSFVVTLPGAGRDSLACRFDCERGRNAMRLQCIRQ